MTFGLICVAIAIAYGADTLAKAIIHLADQLRRTRP